MSWLKKDRHAQQYCCSRLTCSPGCNPGLLEVFRRRYLLSLIVRKEVQIRYRGSVLGWLWSYVKPLVQFLVFYVALGVFLGLNKAIEYYPIYLFSGITIVTFFNEAFAQRHQIARRQRAAHQEDLPAARDVPDRERARGRW